MRELATGTGAAGASGCSRGGRGSLSSRPVVRGCEGRSKAPVRGGGAGASVRSESRMTAESWPSSVGAALVVCRGATGGFGSCSGTWFGAWFGPSFGAVRSPADAELVVERPAPATALAVAAAPGATVSPPAPVRLRGAVSPSPEDSVDTGATGRCRPGVLFFGTSWPGASPGLRSGAFGSDAFGSDAFGSDAFCSASGVRGFGATAGASSDWTLTGVAGACSSPAFSSPPFFPSCSDRAEGSSWTGTRVSVLPPTVRVSVSSRDGAWSPRSSARRST